MQLDMTEYDSARLSEIRGRNVKRVAEIDVVLAEVQPLFEKLLRERDQCSAIIRRIDPPTTNGFPGECTSDAQTPMSEIQAKEFADRTMRGNGAQNTAQSFGHRG